MKNENKVFRIIQSVFSSFARFLFVCDSQHQHGNKQHARAVIVYVHTLTHTL